MKIIHLVLGKANPLRMNGVNKVVHQLAMAQQEKGYDTHVWGITANPVHDYPSRNYHTELFRKSSIPFMLDSNLIKAIRQLPADSVFHIHGAFIPEFFIVSRYLKKRNIPFVYTTHGAFNKVALNRNPFIKKAYFRLFEKQIIQHAGKLHFIGKSEMDLLEKEKNKSVLIPNGQDLNELHFQFTSLRKSTVPVFGFCGRITIDEKGLDLMMEGFARYRKNGNPGEFWIIGDGPDMPQLKRMIKQLNIDADVKLTGSKFGSEKLNLIANMDWFIHTSRNEGMPTAVLEAAALKVPSILSEQTNLAGYITENNAGIALASNTSDEIAKAMLQAISIQKSVKQLGLNAYNMIKKDFNWNHIAGQLSAVYLNQ